jgi:DinB superfamily
MSDPRYPIGRFVPDTQPSPELRNRHIGQIEGLPARMRQAVNGLNSDQLNTPYREGGWTVRQLVHHVPDSHMNAYIRCKLTLTEDVPTIKPYDEAAWAKLADTSLTPVEVSLALLDCIHTRWVALLRSLDEPSFQRQFKHPELGVMKLNDLVALYDWHGNHHLAHVTSLRERMRW